MLIDFVTESIRHIVSEEAADVISRLAASGTQCEKWFQIEVFKRFIRRFPDNKIMLERAYPSGGSNPPRCDLWCLEADGHESWVALKTYATNYGSSGKNITQKISAAISDIVQLKKLPLDAKRHLFLLAYPIPDADIAASHETRAGTFSFSPAHRSVGLWLDQLRKLRDSGATVEEVLRAPINPPLSSKPTYDAVGYTIVPLP
jgi:hypothetical protein